MIQITLASTVLIAAVVLLRFVLLKLKVSRSAVLALWAAVGVRLLLPVSIPSAIGVLPGVIQESQETAAAEAGTLAASSVHFSAETPVFLVYLAGVLALLIYYTVSFRKLSRILRRARSLGEGIYAANEVSQAFIFGVFSPRIILPEGLPVFVRKAVVCHEDEHLRHGDHFWKPLAFFLLALHWFNPLVWLAYFLFAKDLEFACDDRLARQMTVSERKEYAEALLLLGAAPHPASVQTVAFGEGNVEQRIKAVCLNRRPAAVLSVIAVVLAVILGSLAMFYHQESFYRSSASEMDNVTMVPEERITALPEDPYEYNTRPSVPEREPFYDVTETPVRNN